MCAGHQEHRGVDDCDKGFTLMGKAGSCCWSLDLKDKLEKRQERPLFQREDRQREKHEQRGCSHRVKRRGEFVG